MITVKLTVLLAAFLCCTTVLAQETMDEMMMEPGPLLDNPTCMKDTFPVSSGGRGKEDGKCLVYDPNTKLMIMGGVTRSNDYGPSLAAHGFLYAVDLEGNWAWGNVFYNKTNVVEFTGCNMASDGSSVIALGRSYNQTVMMIVNATDGTVVNFYSLENKLIEDENPRFTTFGAVYLDTDDYYDGKAYIYSAFLMRGQLQLVKLAQEVPDQTHRFPEIEYHYQFKDLTDEQQENDFYRQHMPEILFTVPFEQNAIYMAGRYRGLGSIMKLDKKNAQLHWYIRLDQITHVNAIATVPDTRDQHFFGCGYDNYEERDNTGFFIRTDNVGWIFKVNDNGEMQWSLNIAGSRANRQSTASDVCSGIQYDEMGSGIAALIQTKSEEFRLGPKVDNFNDIMLLFVTAQGDVRKAITVSIGNDISIFSQNLIRAEETYYTGGMYYGFETQKQTILPDDDDKNTFLMRLEEPTSGTNTRNQFQSQCLFQGKLERRDLTGETEKYDRSETQDMHTLFYRNDFDVPKSNVGNSVFNPYYSKYPREIKLESQFNTPRLCAYESILLPGDTEYYRGAEAIEYSIRDTRFAYVLTQMDLDLPGSTVVLDQYGKNASAFANFTQDSQGLLTFYTNKHQDVGDTTITLRHCDRRDRLFEINLKVEVLRNTVPKFVDAVDTSFVVNIHETLTYDLPDVEDLEDNAESELLIEPFTGYGEFYPEFMTPYFDNKRLVFRPDSNMTLANSTSFFKIILKEKGKGALSFSYYCTVYVECAESECPSSSTPGGGASRPDPRINNDDSSKIELLKVGPVDGLGLTSITFLDPVDFDILEREWPNILTSYLQKADYANNPVNVTLKNVEAVRFDPEQQKMFLHVEFDDPFVLGLIEEKDDRLFFGLNTSYPLSNLFLNSTRRSLFSTEELMFNDLKTNSGARVNLQFDYTQPLMEFMNKLGKFLFWLLICIVIFQFIILEYDEVSLLIFWEFIAYGQLISYLPLMRSLYVPWLYEVYRPFLISHLICSQEKLGRDSDDLEQRNDSFMRYGIDKEKIVLSLRSIAICFAIIIILDIITQCLYRCIAKDDMDIFNHEAKDHQADVKKNMKCYAFKKKLFKAHRQFRYNIYLRFLTVFYFDLVFTQLEEVYQASEEHAGDITNWKVVLATLILALCVILPILIMIYLCAQFKELTDKQHKQNFNSLLLKVDKSGRQRIAMPAYFFFRRFMTAVVLVLTRNAVLQYLFVIIGSFAYLMFLTSQEPFLKRSTNAYVAFLEFIYFALAFISFLLTDATSDINTKKFVTWFSVVILFVFILTNIIVVINVVRKGRDKLKEASKKEKAKRQNRRDRRKIEHASKEERKRLKEERKEMIGRGENPNIALLQAKANQDKKQGLTVKPKAGQRLVEWGVMSDETESDEEDYEIRFKNAEQVFKRGNEEMTTKGAAKYSRTSKAIDQGGDYGVPDVSNEKPAPFAEIEMTQMPTERGLIFNSESPDQLSNTDYSMRQQNPFDEQQSASVGPARFKQSSHQHVRASQISDSVEMESYYDDEGESEDDEEQGIDDVRSRQNTHTGLMQQYDRSQTDLASNDMTDQNLIHNLSDDVHHYEIKENKQRQDKI